MEYEAELRHKNEMTKLEAELKGKAKIERENRDINLEMMREKAKENRETVLEAIKLGVIIPCTMWLTVYESDLHTVVCL